MRRRYFVSKACLFCFYLFLPKEAISTPACNYKCEHNGKYEHWFTGPIFTPNPTTVQPGHPGIEPVLIVSKTYGLYDKDWEKHSIPALWSVGPYVDFQAGLSKKIAFELIGSIVHNFSQRANFTHLKDGIFRIGYQVSTDNPGTWTPDFRILLQETFPTGKYKKLSKYKKGTDITGQGSFQTGIHFAFRKLFSVWSTHCLSIRGDVGYLIPASLHVKGRNLYTGLEKANGKVRPGQILVAYLTGECSISPEWNICCETFYQYQRKGSFSGKIEESTTDSIFNPKIRSSAQLIIAPEIEHTITTNLGIVFGGSTTITGKNAPAFHSVLLSVLYMF